MVLQKMTLYHLQFLRLHCLTHVCLGGRSTGQVPKSTCCYQVPCSHKGRNLGPQFFSCCLGQGSFLDDADENVQGEKGGGVDMQGPTKRSPRPISSSTEASTSTAPHKRNIFHGWLPMGTICPTSYTAARWQCCRRGCQGPVAVYNQDFLEQNTLFGITIEYRVEPQAFP